MRGLRSWLLPLVVLSVTALAYAPTCTNGFTNWDDPMYVIGNWRIRDPSWENVQTYFTSFGVAGLYHPVTLLSLALDHRLFGLDPRGYHAVSLALHTLNTGLTFAVLRLFGCTLMAAAFGALAFGVHPLRVETVAWVSARKDLLCTAFFLGGVAFYLRYFRRNAGLRRLVLSVLLYLGALLSKPMAVSFPLVLLLCDRSLLQRRWGGRIFLEKLPFVLLSAGFAWLAYVGQKAAGGMRIGEPYSPLAGLLVPARGIALYLSNTVFPVGLSALYPYPAEGGGQLPVAFLAAPALVLLAGAGVWYSTRHTGKVAFGSLFFVLTLLPVMQIVPLGHAYAADRYSYLPSVGLAYLVGEGLSHLFEAQRLRAIPRALLAGAPICALVALSLLTWHRTSTWGDSLSLWDDVVAKYPRSAVAHRNRAFAHAEAGDGARALADFRRSLAMAPSDVANYVNYANALITAGQLEEAIRICRLALAAGPNHEIYNNLGVALARQGRSAEAREQYRQALMLRPGYTAAHVNLGVALAEAGRLSEAVGHYREALRLDPYDLEATFNLAVDLEAMGRPREAAERYREFLRLSPGHPEATARLNRLLSRTGFPRHDRQR